MDKELEEITEGVKNTNSQKSVTTSNVYSTDFTDYSSDKNNSSGKATYVIDWDESDDSEQSCQIDHEQRVFNLTDEISKYVPENKEIKTVQCFTDHQVSNVASKISQNRTFVAQETYTQTSKTIIELAKSDGYVVKSADLKTLQTQTSCISIIESQRVEYNFYNEICSSNSVQNNYNNNWYEIDENEVTSRILSNSLEDRSSKLQDNRAESEDDEEKVVESYRCETTKEEFLNKILDENRLEASSSIEDTCDISLSSNSDIEEDSLMESNCNNIIDKNNFSSKNSDISCTPKSIDNEVKDLYNKVSNCLGVFQVNQNIEPRLDSQWVGVLTPLTEESTTKKDSFIDMTPCLGILTESNSKEVNEGVLFTQNTGLKIKLMSVEKNTDTLNEPFKLPPIQDTSTKSYQNSLNFLLSARCENKGNSTNFNNGSVGRGEFRAKNLAAGESQYINEPKSRLPNEIFHLPPIHTGVIQNIYTNYSDYNSSSNTSKLNLSTAETPCESINIHDKIRELKMTDRRAKNVIVRKEIRSISPTSVSSPEGSKSCDVTQKACEALCTELLRKLKSTSWCEVVDTLEEIPKVMDKFWNVITELRIADLLRQVTVHVDSPRSQVARTACFTLATILKNTNYTRKPDFYEAVTALLVKTGSFSRPVRRAANMALDDIVCGVDFTQAVTALCVHGVGHKSAVVRCASARLLVVCCAVSGGGRGLLRARPLSAAAARRLALRALACLLEDRASDARKYAERLYIMLRPLANFEAYFLTDVDVEVASRQMKKFDQLLNLSSKDR